MDGKKDEKMYACKYYVRRKERKLMQKYLKVFKRLLINRRLPTYKWRSKTDENKEQSASPNTGTNKVLSDAMSLFSQDGEKMDEEPVPMSNDDNNRGNGNNDNHNNYNDDVAIAEYARDLENSHVDSDEADDGAIVVNGNNNTDSDDSGNDEDVDNNGDDDGDGVNINDDNDDDEGTEAYHVQEGPIITLKPNVREHEILIAIMAVAERHKFNLESIVAVINMLKQFLTYNTLPTTKNGLWKKLGRNEANSYKRHIYCKSCKAIIGIGKACEKDCPCGDAGPEKPLSMVSFLIKIDIAKQLKRIFSRPDAWNLLNYRNYRHKIDANNIEDVFDGEKYTNLRKHGNFLNSDLNLSFTINTDGCQVAVSSKESAWPILLSINELPPNARKRFIILAGIWVDKEHPDLNIFMPPIIEELYHLHYTGIEWIRNGMEKVTSKFITTICTCDTPARAKILNTTSYNGKYGCNFCYAPGIAMENGSRKYPLDDIVNRTDAEIRHDMTEATRTEIRQRGLIGVSTLKYLPKFDLRMGVVVDSMHCVDIGVVKKLTQMIIFGQMTDNWFHANAKVRRAIEERLKNIRTPSAIARKTRSIELWKLWKATEWRNWLLYYCVPCMSGLIPEDDLRLFTMLSEAIHVLNSDSMNSEQFVRACSLINDFEARYETIFGLENMTTNMHLLRHLPDAVKCWGPLWAHNAYMFESFNHKILKSLNSSTGRQLQIVNRYLLDDYMRSISCDPNVDVAMKNTVKNILNTGKRLPVAPNNVDYGHYYDFRPVGNVETRYLKNWEKDALREKRLTLNDTITVIKKCIVKGIVYTSRHSDKKNTRSCDKYICTKDGKFAEILNIASFITNEGDRIHGMFVKWFKNTDGIWISEHIKALCVSSKGFIKIQDIRLPAIVMKMNNVIYGVRMANGWETD